MHLNSGLETLRKPTKYIPAFGCNRPLSAKDLRVSRDERKAIVPNCPSHSIYAIFLLAIMSTMIHAGDARGGFLGIEFDADDCIEKYDDKMRWIAQRQLMKDVCNIKHDGDKTKVQRQFAQCVLESIFDVADTSNGRRVIQACSSKTGDDASFRYFVGRIPMAPTADDIDRRFPNNPLDGRQPIIMMGPNGLVTCIKIGQILDCH